MGFFHSINKIWSGADFWDQKENQQQRQDFAQQDEEERRRRAQEAAARNAVSQTPGPQNVQDTPAPDAPINRPSNILTLGDLNMAKQPGLEPAFNPAQALQKAQPQQSNGFLHKVFHNGVTNAVGDAAKGITGIVTAPVKFGVNDIRMAAAKATGNEAARKHAEELARDNIETLKGVPQGIAAAGYKLAESLNPAGGDVYEREHTFTGAPAWIFGDKSIPSLQKSYKDTAAEKGSTYAGTQSFLEVLMDVLGAKGGVKGASKLRSRLVKATPEEAAVIAAEDVAPAIETPPPATTPARPAIVEPTVDLNTPAYVRKAARTADDNARVAADAEAAAADPLNRPAYKHRQDIQDVLDESQNKLDEFMNDHPTATLADVEAARSAIENEALTNVRALQDARFGPSTTAIPDATSPVALAKATGEAAAPATATAPIADFSQAINAPLKKVEATPPPVAEAPIAPGAVDVNGNPALISDAERARQMTAEGTPPMPAASPVAAVEDQMAASADQAARQQVTGDTPAPRTREQLINRVDDSQLQNELLDLAPPKERVNLKQADDTAKATVNNMSDEQLVNSYTNPQRFESPEDLFRGLSASRRLQRIGTEEARQAVRNITDAISEQSSKSGLWQRASQILFEDMPTEMKADYLMKKLNQAGADMTDADRQMLTTLLENSDAAAERVTSLQDEARSLLESGTINNESMAGATRERIGQLTKEIQTVGREQEIAAGKAWEFYRQNLPKGPLGKRFGEIGRTMMLSAPSGRAFDILSTGATTADDLLTRGVSNLIGKTLNKAPGVRAGTLSDTIIAPKQLIKGIREGTRNFVDTLRGKQRVEDFMTESKRATRGDIQGGTAFRRTVRAATNLPTELTRGLRQEELFRQGMQEAAQQGLKGSARRAYAELRAAVPTSEQLHNAIEVHMKANMLHNNRVSRFLNGIAQSLDRGGQGWLAAPIRNQIMPFTSWIGGNLHRTLTDKNVLYNSYKIVDSARKSDIQGVVDNVSKLAVNSGEAYAAGYLLSKAGVLTTEDANGNKYGGVYFHIGDRYIPVAVAGTVSVPIILGNAIHQAQDASDKGDSPMSAFSNAVLANTLKNAGVASVFGGDNTIQSTVGSLTDDKGNPSDAVASYVGDFARQYIPALSSDANSLIDYTGVNPTHEAPQTKVMKENPETGRDKKDVVASEIAGTLAKIPILSQGLPREMDKPARDILDRILHGTHETVKMAGERQVKLTDQQEKERRKTDKVPDTKEGIQARMEDGDYDLALSGWKQQLSDMEKDSEAPKSKKQDIKDEIKRLEITKSGSYKPEVISLYNDTSLTEWRAMADPDSDEYDPDMAGLLLAYDKRLADAGVSKSLKGGDRNKFFEKKKKGSGKGGRGGTAKKPRIVTDIGMTNAPAFNFSPIKAEAANFGAPQSAIPQLEKVPNYSRQLKKISVRRGR